MEDFFIYKEYNRKDKAMKFYKPLPLAAVTLFAVSCLAFSALSCSDTMEDSIYNKNLEAGVFGTSQWDNSKFE